MGKHDTTSRFRLRAVAAAGLVALGVLGAVGTAQAAPSTVEGTPCVAGVRACVDVDEKEAWLIKPAGEIVRGPVDISPGADDTPDPARQVLGAVEEPGPLEQGVYGRGHAVVGVSSPTAGFAFHEGNLDNPSGGWRAAGRGRKHQGVFEYLKVGDKVQVV